MKCKKTKIIDCCTYSGEIDVLKIRLYELYDVVDTFVIVESPYTFSGFKKGLRFPQDKTLLEEKYITKIEYVVFDEFDPDHDAWTRDFNQKTAIYHKGLSKMGLEDTDYILHADLDEIMDSDVLVKEIAKNPTSLRFTAHWFNFNIDNYLGRWPKHSILLCTYQHMHNYFEGAKRNKARMTRITGDKIKEPSGWHLSYFLKPNEILKKLFSYAHFNDKKDRKVQQSGVEYVKEKMKKGGCLFNKRKKRDFNGKLPKYYER